MCPGDSEEIASPVSESPHSGSLSVRHGLNRIKDSTFGSSGGVHPAVFFWRVPLQERVGAEGVLRRLTARHPIRRIPQNPPVLEVD